MSCDELKSPILFVLVHYLRILKKQIWKSNNFADGMDYNCNDHDDWLWSFVWQHMKHYWNTQFAHNFILILYYFLNFDRTLIPPIYFSKKYVLFCKRHTSFINFPLWLLQNVHLQIKKICTKHCYWSCSVSTLSLIRLPGGIFRVHQHDQRNIYHSICDFDGGHFKCAIKRSWVAGKIEPQYFGLIWPLMKP